MSLKPETDPTFERIAQFLWGLLDNIDTASDAAKADDKAYRAMVERIQRCRFEVGSTDGYTVTFKMPAQPLSFIPAQGQPCDCGAATEGKWSGIHSDGCASIKSEPPVDDLPLYWQGRANALRILDKARDKSDAATLWQADAFEECAKELSDALASVPPQLKPEEQSDGAPDHTNPDSRSNLADQSGAQPRQRLAFPPQNAPAQSSNNEAVHSPDEAAASLGLRELQPAQSVNERQVVPATFKPVYLKAARTIVYAGKEAAEAIMRLNGDITVPSPLPPHDSARRDEALRAACLRLQSFLDTFGDVGDAVTQADINDWIDLATPAQSQEANAELGSEREKRLLAEKLEDKKDLYALCVRAEASEAEVERKDAEIARLRAALDDIHIHAFEDGSNTVIPTVEYQAAIERAKR